jgi:hypothetical protein
MMACRHEAPPSLRSGCGRTPRRATRSRPWRACSTCRARAAAPGSAAREGEAVTAGALRRAPVDAAAVVVAGEWKPWEADGPRARALRGRAAPVPGRQARAPTPPARAARAWLRAIGFMLCARRSAPRRAATSGVLRWQLLAPPRAGRARAAAPNLLAAQLARRIAAVVQSGAPAEPRPPLEERARFAVALTHDGTTSRLLLAAQRVAAAAAAALSRTPSARAWTSALRISGAPAGAATSTGASIARLGRSRVAASARALLLLPARAACAT